MSKRQDSYVYVWRNEKDGKEYVGKGRGGRAERHMRNALLGHKTCPLFYNAIRKHGVECFALRYIATGLSDADAIALEIEHIALLGTKAPHGYNITEGGQGASGAVRSEESKVRYRLSKQGERNPCFGKPARNRGVPMSAEQKQKLSDVQRQRDPKSFRGAPGRVHSAEERAKRSASQRLAWAEGRRKKPSAEAVENMKIAQQRRWARVRGETT